MSIVSLDDVKAQLNIAESDDTYDAELAEYIDAITTPIEYHLHEVVDPRACTEDLDLSGYVKFRLTNTPVMSLTSVVSLDGSISYDVTNFKAEPGGLVRVVTGPRPGGAVTVVYQAGYDPIPPNIVRGALEAIQDAWQDSQRGVGGVSGVSRANMEQIRQRLTYVLSYKVSAWLGQPTTLAR